jgi:hypothetical protein
VGELSTRLGKSKNGSALSTLDPASSPPGSSPLGFDLYQVQD